MRETAPRLAPLPATRANASSRPPFISVIVPVRNEAAHIEETLLRLLQQEYDPDRYEILVADGRSTDATRQLVSAIAEWRPNVVLLDNPRQWSSAGRNVALRAARGELLVVVDGHCELDNPRYLADLADAFARSGADCIGRPQPLDVSQATPLQRAIAAARASRLGHHPSSHIWSQAEGFVPPQSVAVAYRRSIFETIGLFDESFDACEDVELNHRLARAGLRCFFTPRVGVRYHPRGNLTGLCRQMVRYGRGRARLLRKHPETFTPAGFVPAAFVAGIIAGLPLAWAFPLLAWVYGGALALYAAAVAGVTVILAARHRQPGWLLSLPLIFLAIHLGAGVGILHELIAGSARPAPLEAQPVPQRRAA